jgi:hypothetical protein
MVMAQISQNIKTTARSACFRIIGAKNNMLDTSMIAPALIKEWEFGIKLEL